ncbi:hypothetical protein Prudu_005313 [Prunus dulcis]|uniref:Disease resistance protein At4g27190-like leucine-rich repeats domain-containing protein n=1 Tax=Prunus dulcis TaxID=3755 RepID=A0A4Y1QXC7_PRUDU|nr:hypothetical protein Prudu_005313 [Prunus dulcis]
MRQFGNKINILKPNEESVNKMKETRNDNQVAGSTSSKSKVAQVGASCKALFPSNCISWLPNLEKLELSHLRSMQGSEENNESIVNVVVDLEGHDSAFSQLQTFQVWSLYGVEHLWKNVQPGFQVLAAASTEDNIHEEGKETVSKNLPAAVAENLSDDHVRGREELGSDCASSTGSGFGFGCAPLVCLQSRPSTRNFTQILPRPVNREETPSTQAFDKLRELRLLHLPMLSHIWEKGLQILVFTAHSQTSYRLETVEVSSCSAMEKIVGEAEGGGESIEDELTFPHVNSIVLGDLPELESFCSEAYTLKWPALEKVKVQNCPKLKAFAPESICISSRHVSMKRQRGEKRRWASSNWEH